MGLNAACSILELGGDVVCFDRMDRPLSELWCSSTMILSSVQL